MKNLLCIVFFFLLCQFSFGQLELPYTSSIKYGNFVNPAHVDRDSVTQFVFLNREQWNGAIGAPSSQLIGAMVPLDDNSKIGANVFRNRSGVSGRFTFDLNYNYLLRLNEAKIRFGILASFQQERKDFTQASVLLNDPLAEDAVIA